MLALNGTGSHLEIGKAMTAMLTVFIEHFPGGVPCVPHLPNGRTMHHVEYIAPKTTRPSGSTHGQVLHLGLLAAAHVGKALGRHVCCCDTATNQTYYEESFHIAVLIKIDVEGNHHDGQN